MERGQEWRKLSGGVRAAGALSRTVKPNPPIRRSNSWRKLSGGVKVAAKLKEAVKPPPLVRTDSWRKPRGVLHVVSAFGKVRHIHGCRYSWSLRRNGQRRGQREDTAPGSSLQLISVLIVHQF